MTISMIFRVYSRSRSESVVFTMNKKEDDYTKAQIGTNFYNLISDIESNVECVAQFNDSEQYSTSVTFTKGCNSLLLNYIIDTNPAPYKSDDSNNLLQYTTYRDWFLYDITIESIDNHMQRIVTDSMWEADKKVLEIVSNCLKEEVA